MSPTYLDGHTVVVDTQAYDVRPPRTGDVVLLGHPFKRALYLVKRVAYVTAEGQVFVVGDNPTQSTDSRSFGPVDRGLVVGRVVGRLEDGDQQHDADS